MDEISHLTLSHNDKYPLIFALSLNCNDKNLERLLQKEEEKKTILRL